MGLYPSGYREGWTGESSWRAPRMALFPYCCSVPLEPCRGSPSRSQVTCRWQECSGDACPPSGVIGAFSRNIAKSEAALAGQARGSVEPRVCVPRRKSTVGDEVTRSRILDVGDRRFGTSCDTCDRGDQAADVGLGRVDTRACRVPPQASGCGHLCAPRCGSP